MCSATVTDDTRGGLGGGSRGEIAVDPRIARSRAKILDAATDLLVEGGSRAVVVDAVAERSGVAKSTMYRHFPTRAELLVEVLKFNLPDIEPPPISADFKTSLRVLVHRMADALSQPGQERVLPALIALKNTAPDIAALAEEHRGQRLGLVEQILEQGVGEGVLPPGTSDEVSCTLLIGPLMFATLMGNKEQLTAIADQVADQFLTRYGIPLD